MPPRADVFQKGRYYHIYNRGAGKYPIFFNTGNYYYCLRLAFRYARKYSITVVAYCLMPNHFHFLLRQNTDSTISKYIGVLFNAYTQAVNRQQKRCGTLFQGRFSHCLVDDESYLLILCRYIHLNPVKAGLVKSPEQWPFSNYCAWIDPSIDNRWDNLILRTYFPRAGDYLRFVNEVSDSNLHFGKIEPQPSGDW